MSKLTAVFQTAEQIARGLAITGMCGLTAATLVLIADIALRKSLAISILGTVDMTQLAVITCVYFALPLAFLIEAHVGVDFVTDALPPRALAVVKTLSALASTAMMGAITVFTFKQALLQIGQADRSQTLGLPIALYWTPLLLGATLSVVTGALLALRHAAGIRDSGRAR